jgi:superfamily II DNA or RNA helicase
MSATSDKPAPVFDRDYLVDLGGWAAYKEGKRLFEEGLVSAVEWEFPILKGVVGQGRSLFRPQLNLRSSVFAENKCSCAEGRRGIICAHAIAICLAYQAQVDGSSDVSSIAEEPLAADEGMPETNSEPAGIPDTVQSIQIDEKSGSQLRLRIFLPPNFSATAPLDAIVIKLEAISGKNTMPLERIDPSKVYRPAKAHRKLLAILEFLCGGRLASLLQVTRAQLLLLLEPIQGTPSVYWVTQPDEPIEWSRGRLEGVHDLLEAEESTTPVHAQAGMVTVIPTEDSPTPSPAASANGRPQSQTNSRRDAEQGAFANWNTRAGDYPVANAATAQLNPNEHPAHRIIVDGSPNYLAIRLPREESVSELRDLLKSNGFILEPSNRQWWLRDRHKTLNFLAEYGRDLRGKWKAIFTRNYDEQFKCMARATLRVRVEERPGGFRFKAGLRGSDALELRKALSVGKKYVEESHSGRIVLIDSEVTDQLHMIERCVSGQSDRTFSPQFEKVLDRAELADVEALIRDVAPHWKPPAAWQRRSAALRQTRALKRPPLPKDLRKRLRGYQRIGVAWLWHLYRNELGGILADEMGLGKTIQALGLIACAHSQNENARALVVVPASLVENWSREAKMFVPHLPVLKHHGTQRPDDINVIKPYRIVITSYGTLQRDSEMLRSLAWDIVIGDEAQHIKNRKTQNAHALRTVGGKHRFLLTGTPIENSIDDLYSLFEFLMPGYLVNAPGSSSSDEKEWYAKRQTQRAAPYILRRTKREVAPELPEKIEETFFCSFGDKQDRFYRKVLEKTRREIFEMEMAGASEGRVRMAAFTELLRLRQACVDPRILDASFGSSDSAKWRAFEEILSACIDSGSRILVFSSFVSALKLLRDELESAGHRFCYIDGQTRNRQEQVDIFNNDPGIPVFLISLKAGGTGLNLTGADTVVHFDPWWNPAAEAQATDRAHRIGQTRVVTSIRLIAANTVEEKVLELQQRKAQILKDLFEESANANGKVSLEDIKSLLED